VNYGLGMMVSMAIGDAYGAGFEFAAPEVVAQHNNLSGYRPHPKGTIRPGKYTDDTQMAIGLAEWMLNRTPETHNSVHLARKFVEVFHRDPRKGYAEGFYKLLKENRSGSRLLQALTPISRKAGGAMRAAPCGLLLQPEQVIDLAMWQASLTHATREGMLGAAGAALLVWACRQGCDRGYLGQMLEDMLPGCRWTEPWRGYVSGQALATVRAALTAVVDQGTMSGILTQSVAYTGDTDTVAAIAMAAGAMHPNVTQDLPTCLVSGVENNRDGFTYLQQLDDNLLSKFPPPVEEKPIPDAEEEDGGIDEFLEEWQCFECGHSVLYSEGDEPAPFVQAQDCPECCRMGTMMRTDDVESY